MVCVKQGTTGGHSCTKLYRNGYVEIIILYSCLNAAYMFITIHILILLFIDLFINKKKYNVLFDQSVLFARAVIDWKLQMQCNCKHGK